MRRSILLAAVLCAVVIGCSGPPETADPAALFTDLDLESAEAIADISSLAFGLTEHTVDVAGLLSSSSSGSRSLDAASVEALGHGKSSKNFSVGGYLVYVEHNGRDYSIRLAKLDEDSDPGRRGDQIIYRGRKPIQSVAVSGDGSVVAFVAPGRNGSNDVYVLDVKRKKASATTTAGSESDISMSLDGRYLSWQGETANGKSLVWFENGVGGIMLDPAVFAQFYGLPMTMVQPSLSGNGMSIATVETSGNLAALISPPAGPVFTGPVLAVLTFSVDANDQVSLLLSAIYLGDVSEPSLDYGATKVLFQELFGGTNYLSVIDRSTGGLTDILVGDVDHPYLTADGDFLTFSFGGNAYVGTTEGDIGTLSPSTNSTDSATYWARGNFTAYDGSNTSGPFVRPDDGGGLDAAGRTVGYHVYEFVPPTTDYYSILSVQDYDGYLTLYQKNFSSRRPERNVVANNDDFGGSWDGTLGQSRIVALLNENVKYFIVTSACGAPGTPCGPAAGTFENLITDGATPPLPPTELPAPDDSKFNITLRFWDDSLTAEEQAVFQQAADRWAAAIVQDVENIQNFVLSEDQTTTGAPGLFGVLDDVVIDAAKVPIDGPSAVLARAGAFYVRAGGADDFLPTYGIMEFDEAEFGPGQFFESEAAFAAVIMHEMGHVLGISRSFWIPLGLIEGNPADINVCSDVAVGGNPRYTGAQGNDAWVNFYGADSAQVPIANTGGCGTADSHWRELHLDDELMTGYAAGGSEPLSRVTIGALADLGYGVNFEADDPWTLPVLPTLSQVAPVAQDYEVEFDFTSAFTGSLFGEVEAPVTAVDLALSAPATSTSGCEASDFAGFPAGNIALVQRGTCPFFDKAANALAAGAVGVLIGNQGSAPDRMAPTPGTLGVGVNIVAMPISFGLLQELANTPDLIVNINTSKDAALRAQALDGVSWHLAEEFVPLRGSIDQDGNVTNFDD